MTFSYYICLLPQLTGGAKAMATGRILNVFNAFPTLALVGDFQSFYTNYFRV